MRIVNHDIHVHTFLSSCSSDPKATPENYIRRAAELGLRTIGFADHLWDGGVPGASRWYAPQDLNHILQSKRMLPEDTQGVRVLIGCESEYCGDGKVGLSTEGAKQLDFVLLPMSHFHMVNFVRPETVTEPRDVAELLVQRFLEVVDLGIATGIAHPFLPLGFIDQADEIISKISDMQFTDCFGRAAEAGVSIEIQPGFFPQALGIEKPGLHDETYMRMFSVAKQVGCYFHFGSDAHSLDRLDTVLALEKRVRELGIGEDDILPCLRAERS
ncbi:MAG: PHP domain-containing protein [Firmicutes bacterium]|jgi:histidinol phosphatase-like PHP family hydrolase|nr:PHP domain-containing protein [Bacillota bacterium]